MGTSASYGGTNVVGWADVKEELDRLLSDVAGGDSADDVEDSSTDDSPTGEDLVSDLVSAIAAALLTDDPELSPLRPATRPRRGGDSGLNVDALVASGRGRPSLGRRTSGRGRRNVVGGARRAGTALGAAFALHNGDAAKLEAYGLKLAELVDKTRAEQVLAIAELLKGNTAGPDDYALRNAVVKQLNRVLAGDASDPAEALRDLIAEYVIEVALVELEAIAERNDYNQAELIRLERDIKNHAHARVQRLDVSGAKLIQPAQFQDAAEKVAKAVISVLQAVTS